MDNYSPIVLFVYNRPEHTLKVLNALFKNELASESELFIFSDGPKENATEKDKININNVRRLIKEKQWCKSVKIFESNSNKGLSKSIILGVTEIINKYKKIIVLEDDIIPSKGFLRYMNDALMMYKDEKSVGCIHAWNYSLDTRGQKETTFFLKGADCWGWATWKDSWDLFENEGEKLMAQIVSSKSQFDFERRGTHSFMKMLEDQINGKNDSWAIRWHASLFLNNKFCLQPVKPIVKNIGLDNSGTHNQNETIDQFPIDYIRLKKIEVSEKKWFFDSYKKTNKMKLNLKMNLKRILKLFIPPIIFKIKNFKNNDNKNILTNKIWQGKFYNWEEASKNAIGYDNALILEKVSNSLLKVKNGEVKYERDSTLFNKIQHNWIFLSAIQKVIIETSSNLNVIDFGGSLGSNFFYIKNILGENRIDKWSIIEQSHFVDRGRKLFQNEQLKFYYTIDECLESNNPNIIILGSVLQYLEDPYDIFEKLLKTNIKYILIDRTAFINSNSDCISLQNIVEFEAKVQHWFFSDSKFKEFIKKHNRKISIEENSYINFDNKDLNSCSKFIFIE